MAKKKSLTKKNLRIFAFGGNEVSPVGLKDPKTGKDLIPDIALQWQRTVDTCGAARDIVTEGRHDPCICPRVVPVVEAMTALTLEDHVRRQAAMRA